MFMQLYTLPAYMYENSIYSVVQYFSHIIKIQKARKFKTYKALIFRVGRFEKFKFPIIFELVDTETWTMTHSGVMTL
jgi:hypothetical protein